jgi:hypothetical protein
MADAPLRPDVRAALDAAAARVAAPLWQEVGLRLGAAWAAPLARLRAICGDAWAAEVAEELGADSGPARDAGPAVAAAAGQQEALGWLTHAISDDVPAARVAIALAARDAAAAAAALEALPCGHPDAPLLAAFVARALGHGAPAGAALDTLPPRAQAALLAGLPITAALDEPLPEWVAARLP